MPSVRLSDHLDASYSRIDCVACLVTGEGVLCVSRPFELQSAHALVPMRPQTIGLALGDAFNLRSQSRRGRTRLRVVQRPHHDRQHVLRCRPAEPLDNRCDRPGEGLSVDPGFPEVSRRRGKMFKKRSVHEQASERALVECHCVTRCGRPVIVTVD